MEGRMNLQKQQRCRRQIRTALSCRSHRRVFAEEKRGQQCQLLLRKLKTEQCLLNPASWRTLVTWAAPCPSGIHLCNEVLGTQL